jgi:competence protein ComEC
LAAWHFLRLAPVAPLASLAAIPLAGLILVLGLALVALGGVPVVGSLLALVTQAAVALLVAGAEIFARLPFASVDTGRPSLPWMLAYGAALVVLALGSRRARRVALAIAVALVGLLLPGTPNPPDELSLTAIDVGHGDALVLRLPGGRNVLVDGGGAPGSSFDVGAAVVLPYLQASGVRSLDAVVLTHTDYDHLGGLLSVVEEMPVGAIWEGPPRYDRAAYRALRGRAARRGIPFRRLAPGDSFDWGGVRFEVLAAGGLRDLRPTESNDQSVVLRLVYGRSRLLLTGDAEGPVEEALSREPARTRADVLKVAHHGSRTSTSAGWLEAVAPRIAVISGRRSEGRPLPSLEVLERLAERDVLTLRTDVSGAVTVRMDAQGELSFETFLETR